MAFLGPAPVVPLYIQLGDGEREHLGDVTVALNPRGHLGDDGRYRVALGVVDTALLSDQVAALLEHAARTLRKEAI